MDSTRAQGDRRHTGARWLTRLAAAFVALAQMLVAGTLAIYVPRLRAAYAIRPEDARLFAAAAQADRVLFAGLWLATGCAAAGLFIAPVPARRRVRRVALALAVVALVELLALGFGFYAAQLAIGFRSG